MLQAALEGRSLERVVQITAVLSGLVPYGLFLLIVRAYTAGAVTSSRRGALVQLVNAVESVSNVDVVCTDKTGTLTTGRLTVVETAPVDGQDAEPVAAALGSMARSAGAANLTRTALAAHLPGDALPVVDEVPFSSSLRWSAVRTADSTWVLGAPAALAGSLSDSDLAAPVSAPHITGATRPHLRPGDRPRRYSARPGRKSGAAPPWSRWPWSRWQTNCARTPPRPSPD